MGFVRRKGCKFCAAKLKEIDYKKLDLYRSYVTERGKIIPRRISGNCAYHQRQLTKAIKLARMMALLPFKAE